MMIKAKVKEDFNDIKNNRKRRKKDTFITVDKNRYEELYSKGKLYEGKEVVEKKSKGSD
ncbi:MAG: hypothetical protein HFJ12_01520 [Bacilli bacterium]|nr:hypothetical protein [Bacilli bacterium]